MRKHLSNISGCGICRILECHRTRLASLMSDRKEIARPRMPADWSSGGRNAACRWRWDYVFWLPRMIDLDEGDLYVVPKGTKHRPVYESAVIYILIEPEGILNPCNTGGS